MLEYNMAPLYYITFFWLFCAQSVDRKNSCFLLEFSIFIKNILLENITRGQISVYIVLYKGVKGGKRKE